MDSAISFKKCQLISSLKIVSINLQLNSDINICFYRVENQNELNEEMQSSSSDSENDIKLG